ncbi:MAG: hypothetical protein ACOX61_03705 [Brooklawnia sp.]
MRTDREQMYLFHDAFEWPAVRCTGRHVAEVLREVDRAQPGLLWRMIHRDEVQRGTVDELADHVSGLELFGGWLIGGRPEASEYDVAVEFTNIDSFVVAVATEEPGIRQQLRQRWPGGGSLSALRQMPTVMTAPGELAIIRTLLRLPEEQIKTRLEDVEELASDLDLSHADGGVWGYLTDDDFAEFHQFSAWLRAVGARYDRPALGREWAFDVTAEEMEITLGRQQAD